MSFNTTNDIQLAPSHPSPFNINLLTPLTSMALYITLDLLGAITDKMRACIILAACGSYLASHPPGIVDFETNNTVLVETPTAEDLEGLLGPYPQFPHMWHGVYGDMAVYGDYERDGDEEEEGGEDEDVGADATPIPPAEGSFGVKKIVGSFVLCFRASDALRGKSMDRSSSTFVINKAESIKEEELFTFEFGASDDDTLFPPNFASSLEDSDWDSLDDILDAYRSDSSCSPDFPSSETAFSITSPELVDDCKPAADSSSNSFDPQPGSVLHDLLDEYLSDPCPDFDDDTELTLLPYSPTTSSPSPTFGVSTIDTDDFLAGTIDAKLSQIWPTDPRINDAPLPYNLTHEPASPFDEILEELEKYIDQQQHATHEEHTTFIPRAIVPKKKAQTSISYPGLPRTATQYTQAPPHLNIAIPPGKKPATPAPASNIISINPLQSCLSKPHHSSKRGTHRPMLEADSSPASVNLESLSPLELDRLTRFNSWKNLFVNDISSPIYHHSHHRPEVSGPRSMHAACPPPAMPSTRTKKRKSVRFHPAVTNIDIRICPRYLRTRHHRDPDGEVIERPVFSLIPLRE